MSYSMLGLYTYLNLLVLFEKQILIQLDKFHDSILVL